MVFPIMMKRGSITNRGVPPKPNYSLLRLPMSVLSVSPTAGFDD